MTLTQVTNAMQRLEIDINRQQAYIAKCGEANDKASDKNWETYKSNAVATLAKWDELKAFRNNLKTA